MTEADPMPFEVWRSGGGLRGPEAAARFRWRWIARLYAWEHEKRGWFKYRVHDARTSVIDDWPTAAEVRRSLRRLSDFLNRYS